MQQNKIEYFRNFIFGVEDSLVSTVGLLSGVAAAGQSSKTIVLTGFVLVFVEAFSMAVGSLVSENGVAELSKKQSVPLRDSLGDAVVMFVSYLVSGFLVVSPYIFLSSALAFEVSIAASLVALILLGLISGFLTGTSKARGGLVMFLLGGSAIALGILVGKIVERI